MKLIALKKISRGTPQGHVFEIRDREARALIALKLAKPYEADETLDLMAVEAPRQKRQYRRRDMTAIP